MTISAHLRIPIFFIPSSINCSLSTSSLYLCIPVHIHTHTRLFYMGEVREVNAEQRPEGQCSNKQSGQQGPSPGMGVTGSAWETGSGSCPGQVRSCLGAQRQSTLQSPKGRASSRQLAIHHTVVLRSTWAPQAPHGSEWPCAHLCSQALFYLLAQFQLHYFQEAFDNCPVLLGS